MAARARDNWFYRPQVLIECTRVEETSPMDTNVMIMFASVLCTMTALCFMELRRIRKKLEAKPEAKAESK